MECYNFIPIKLKKEMYFLNFELIYYRLLNSPKDHIISIINFKFLQILFKFFIKDSRVSFVVLIRSIPPWHTYSSIDDFCFHCSIIFFFGWSSSMECNNNCTFNLPSNNWENKRFGKGWVWCDQEPK